MQYNGQTSAFRSISLTLLVIFALAPCTVKVGLFDALDIAYVQSLNKSRATTPISGSCGAEPLYSASHAQEIAKKPLRSATDFYYRLRDVSQTSAATYPLASRHRFPTAVSTPPKYILFKRLRLAPAA